MSDFERYSDYNDYEDDEPRGKSRVGLILKLLIGLVIISVVGLIAFRIVIFNSYPDSVKNIYFNDKLTDYYNKTGGEIGAVTQALRAEYDDPDKGNFFAGNLIVIPGIDQLQVSLRYNTSLMTEIENSFIEVTCKDCGAELRCATALLKNVSEKGREPDYSGCPECGLRLEDDERVGIKLDPNDPSNFEFSLSVLPLSKDDGTAYPTGKLTVCEFDESMMYRYYKLVFDDVDLTLEGEKEVWIRLEIAIKGVEMKERYMILVYEDTKTSTLDEYVLSSKERPNE
jgi:hypothetical protein